MLDKPSTPEIVGNFVTAWSNLYQVLDSLAKAKYPNFANSRYYIGLQAARLLAWQTRKEIIQKSGGFDSTAHFKELFALTPGHMPVTDRLSRLFLLHSNLGPSGALRGCDLPTGCER
jgi:hypothetical protein